MGGDLPAAPEGKAPTFLVAALKDAYSGNLDRIQIVKGWLDAERRHPGEGLRRRLERRPPAGRRRQAAAGRQHRRRGAGDLDQHHRRPRADRGLDRPRLRPGARGLLLRQGHRDPDPALDRLRGAALRRRDARRRADDHPGARLHLADLVHARADERCGGQDITPRWPGVQDRAHAARSPPPPAPAPRAAPRAAAPAPPAPRGKTRSAPAPPPPRAASAAPPSRRRRNAGQRQQPVRPGAPRRRG